MHNARREVTRRCVGMVAATAPRTRSCVNRQVLRVGEQTCLHCHLEASRGNGYGHRQQLGQQGGIEGWATQRGGIADVPVLPHRRLHQTG